MIIRIIKCKDPLAWPLVKTIQYRSDSSKAPYVHFAAESRNWYIVKFFGKDQTVKITPQEAVKHIKSLRARNRCANT